MREATFYSNGWSRARPVTSDAAAPDIDALVQTLSSWSLLQGLTLSGYMSYPQLLTDIDPTRHDSPSYQLEGLRLVNCNVDGSTLLWLLGGSACSLTRLTLSATSGLDAETLAHILKLVGPTLQLLNLAVDRDDFASPRPDSLDPAMLAPLVNLRSIILSSDQMFGDEDVLCRLAALPRLQNATLAFVLAFRHSNVAAFLENDLPTLDTLILDTW